MTFGSTGTNGLDGQVITNTNSNASTTFDWTGSIKRQGPSSTALTHPANVYSALSSTFGTAGDYGAVGHAKYKLHAEDCQPANDPSWLSSEPTTDAAVSGVDRPQWLQSLASIKARFFGPIALSTSLSTGEQGVTIEYRTALTPCRPAARGPT